MNNNNGRYYPANTSDAYYYSNPPPPPVNQVVPSVNPNYYHHDGVHRDSYLPTAPPSEIARQQQFYHYSAIPIPQRYATIIVSKEPTRHFPVNAAFFLLGFVFPGLWCIGACCWKRPDKYEVFWRRLNIIMTWISIIGLVLGTMVMIKLIEEEGILEPGHGDNSGDLPPIPPY